MTFLKQNWLKISFVIAAIIIIGFQYLQNQELKYDLIFLKAVPRVYLYNQVEFSSSGYHSIHISGSVAFKNISDQPKDLVQYYMIESLLERDDRGKQLFNLREVIAFHILTPSEFDPVLLKVKSDTATKLILEDEPGNTFTIDKFSGEVAINDITGDRSYLITNSSEHQDFMFDFLK